MGLQNGGEGNLGWQKTPSRLPGTISPESQGPGSPGLAPHTPSPEVSISSAGWVGWPL